MKQFKRFWNFLFLVNALQLNIVEGDGGGAAGAGGEGDGGEGGAGGAGEGGATEGGEGGQSGADGGNTEGKGKLEDLPAWAQSHIKELRTESASNRTKFKEVNEKFDGLTNNIKKAFGMEDDSATPEQQIESLTQTSDSLTFQNAILNVAVENGLSKDQSDYFGYLLGKEGESLDDGAELSEEAYGKLIEKAKSLGGGKGGQSANTSVDDEDGNPPAGGGDNSDVTVEKFANMNYNEKVELRQKSPELYNKLFSEARSKRLI